MNALFIAALFPWSHVRRLRQRGASAPTAATFGRGGDEGTRLPCEAYWGAARTTLTPEGFPAPPPLPSKFLPVRGEFRLWSLDCFSSLYK